MKEILVETSARHIHVNEEQLHILFGKDAKLEVRAYLSQPGQFVSNSRLNIVGPKRTLENVSILGPFRKDAQVEISATEYEEGIRKNTNDYLKKQDDLFNDFHNETKDMKKEMVRMMIQ